MCRAVPGLIMADEPSSKAGSAEDAAGQCRACGLIGGEGKAGPDEGGGAAEQQDGVCLTTVDRLWTEAVKREKLAVQQPNRKAPPFPDISPRTRYCPAQSSLTGSIVPERYERL